MILILIFLAFFVSWWQTFFLVIKPNIFYLIQVVGCVHPKNSKKATGEFPSEWSILEQLAAD